MRAYLGLGGNLGSREANMRAAARRISQALPVTGVSSLYETAPVGFQDQPAFLNAVLAVDAPDDPRAILPIIQRIEADLGRERTFANAPRIIDIDVLLLEHVVLVEPELEIPHPRMHQRAFVLVPMAEIAPDLRHPVLDRTIKELLAGLGDTSSDVWPVAGQDWIDTA